MTPFLDAAACRPCAPRIGIEKIGVYPCSLALPIPVLCGARGRDPVDIVGPMMIDERSLNPLWEDPVTMAVNAANSMLTDEDRHRIELLIVASESSVDYEKPMSTWVHRYCDLQPNCRNFEIKHACYGGTAALQMAACWLASGSARGAKALLINTDQSREHIGKPWEFVLGAGATAVLLSHEPNLLELEFGQDGYWTHEVSDLIRPTACVETGNSETSLVSYMEALEGAFEHFLARVPEARQYDACFSRHVYHMPFGGIAWRAHKTLLRFADEDVGVKQAWANFERKGLAGLQYIRRMGATYSSSTFIGLVGLIDGAVDLTPGERLSIFSYGSGCCAEFYCARTGKRAHAASADAAVRSKLDARRIVEIPEYECIETQRAKWAECGDYEVSLDGLGGWYDEFYRGRRLLTFHGVKDFYRQYSWS
jgi:3-hydroxy-3-methylglutaryl CoA synthase